MSVNQIEVFVEDLVCKIPERHLESNALPYHPLQKMSDCLKVFIFPIKFRNSVLAHLSKFHF
jgi:hypothetical protein